jgi:hypothetical protein
MAAPPGHLARDRLRIERTFPHNLSGKAKSETKHKGVGFHRQITERVVEFLPSQQNPRRFGPDQHR